jgi:uncharacterized Fe-S cluster-containing protein
VTFPEIHGNIYLTRYGRRFKIMSVSYYQYKYHGKIINVKIESNHLSDKAMENLAETLKKMDVYGAIVGKAIYSGSVSLSEAIYEGRGGADADKKDNPLPGC